MQIDEFISHLKRGGSRPAITGDSGLFSYDDLHGRIVEYAAWLSGEAIGDSYVMLIGDYGISGICMLLALWSRNNVVALTAPKNADRIDNQATASGIQFVLKQEDTGAFSVVPKPPTEAPPTISLLLSQEQPGFIVFSSGSTGPAKGVVHRASPFLERYTAAEPCGTILAFLLFDHIGGLVTALHALATHGTLVIPGERSPHEVGRCIEHFGVETLHVSPTLLNLAILAGVFQQWNTRSLRRIYYGTEPIAAELLRRIERSLPEAELRQLYGMSEIGVLPCRSKRDDSAWMKIDDPDYAIKVVDGILHVRGKTTMIGYLSGGASFSSDGYFITEDCAEENDGYFKVKGRSTDIINVGGHKVLPSDIETVLMDVENVADVVVYGQSNPILGQIVAASFVLSEPENLDQFKARLYRTIRGALSPEQIPRSIAISQTPLYTSRFKKIRNPSTSVAQEN